jgi:hypothetical protein
MGWMLASDYWTGSLAEYGVGAGVAKGLVVMTDPAPATLDDSDLKTMIKAMIKNGVVPPPNASTVLSFIISESTNSTMQGGQGCQDYGGYHSQTQTAVGSGVYVAYAVNLQCPGGSGSLFDSLTDVISHEAAEASTDPLPFTMPGWTNDTVPLGGEVGDLCVGLDTTFMATVGDVDAGITHESYVVQRLYSEKIALQGKSDPCIPAPASPYFNVATDPVDINITTTAGAGATTVKLEPYAFGNVGVIHWSLGMPPGMGVTVTPQKGDAHAGETIPLSITVTSTAGRGNFPLLLVAQTDDGNQNEWFGSINVR